MARTKAQVRGPLGLHDVHTPSGDDKQKRTRWSVSRATYNQVVADRDQLRRQLHETEEAVQELQYLYHTLQLKQMQQKQAISHPPSPSPSAIKSSISVQTDCNVPYYD